MKLCRIDNNFKDKDKLYKVNNEAFPDEERIPSEKIIDFCSKRQCDFWAIYDDENFSGFTVILPDEELKVAYIWFLAISSEYRSKGLGTKTLQELNNKYNDYQLVLDMEIVDEKAINIEQRKKRLAFYKKNGYIQTNFGMSYFGVDYEIMSNKDDFRVKDFQALLEKIKVDGFNPKIYPIK